jgi:hypothetical protein
MMSLMTKLVGCDQELTLSRVRGGGRGGGVALRLGLLLRVGDGGLRHAADGEGEEDAGAAAASADLHWRQGG